MNILVTVKSVIDVDLNIRVRDGAVVEEGLNYVLNRWDETAVEAALQLKEEGDGEVTVISIGPDRAGEALRKSLAMGADKAIHVNDPAAEGSDSFGFARILAKAMEKGSYDLVITGKQSQDTDMGATGAILAELAGLPCVINVIQLKRAGEGKLDVHRLADMGREVLEVTLPAVVTSNDSLNEPRLASLRGIMAAKKKPMEKFTLAGLGVDPGEVGAAGSRIEVLEFLPPPERAAGQKFEGEEEETTRKVVDLLVNEAKIFA